ncbi:hypothetical protein [Pseudomonas sp. ANT_H12B]|uniref:hypothetical protein n=1 Tax=Pseudomonas sp. ANT_H12B TaxID=2597348 RepID=UPI0011ECB15C|nr:hypothetical protein [Pseudomonas sp. ANT_H12B]KAA0980467.1 hypothetical protein FQ185_02475 [Pseudomonas sp. ANT_H12B]
MTTSAHRPRAAHVIRSDVEAIAIAHKCAARFDPSHAPHGNAALDTPHLHFIWQATRTPDARSEPG